ncbi:MAG: polysaccharide export protein [Myxococcota bacterium]|nr:polysaccharide export protein [Myxococcota bacterium]MDW8364127.1 polysaccharide biosynthesis/export family protein [Myxococcales bacterium]
MRTIGVMAIACAMGTAGACGGSRPLPPPPAPAVDDTSLGAGDVFDVRVHGEQDLSGTFRVANDGTIDFPFVGRLAVAGLEPPAVADLIAGRLREAQYLVSPQVSVFVREYNSKRVSVVGAVDRPGTFPLTPGLTLVQLISQAGGFTPLAARSQVVLTRRNGMRTVRFRVDADRVTEGRAQDVPLQAGDLVFVPERVF